MTTPVIVSQKLVTESIVQLMEFDFTSIGGSNKVYIANELERKQRLNGLILLYHHYVQI